jgi:dipeptidyl-peptidase-4
MRHLSVRSSLSALTLLSVRSALSALTLLSVLSVPSALSAQQLPADVDSTLHLIYASREFAGERFGPARWIENGKAYTTVERSRDVEGGSDIVRYETASGKRSILVSARSLVPRGDSAALDFDDYSWSPDNAKLMLFTNTQKVWRSNTRGDYWVLDRKGGTLTKLGGSAEPSTLMYAKFSPQGDRVAYVMKGDIYVENLADQKITRLTTGADSLHVNGMSDWVYEEEFGLRDGFRWSPDGTRIAFFHFDMTGVGTFLLINDTDSLYPFVIPIQYPKSGTTNSAVTAGVVSASGGKVTWLDIPGEPRDNYLPWMEWAGKDEVMVQRINRRQDTDNVMLVNVATGKARTVVPEHDEAWVDLVDDVPWLEGGKEFLWTSERDGWRHVWRIARDDGKATLVTRGNFDVSVAGVDQKAGWLYFIASPHNATQRFLYRTRLDGSGNGERVTPADAIGNHRYAISPDGKWALHTASSFDVPPTTDLVKLPSHQSARMLVANDTLRMHVKPWVAQPGEFFQVTVSDSATLDGWMIKPAEFDSTKTYPILMYVYGEPAGQTAQDSWMGSSRIWYQMLANKGYLVATVDNRGTPSPKGRAWRKVVYGAVGVLSSKEQADAVRVLARTRSYVDSTRVAIWGWSGGGTNTLNAMFRYPDVYNVGMSVAPVPDQRLYDTIYQERYMGTPEGNPEGYKQGSAINWAEGLKGELLLMHGSGDDNVHFQGSQRLLNRLISLNKQVDFLEYPNRTHCICEGRGTTLHVYSTLTRYLLTHLEAGGR